MNSRGYFIFNGFRSSDYGVLISGDQTFNAPARDIDEIEIPGRDGVLTLDNGRFLSIKHSYKAFIVDGFADKVEQFRNMMMSVRGKARLTDSYHPDEFYMARYDAGLTVKTNRPINAGEFDITFVRDPRRFLLAGETVMELSATGCITNPTMFDSKPVIRVYGNGSVTIGGVTCAVTDNTLNYIDIDCEMQDCYRGTTNMNGSVTFSGDDFPTIPPGFNTVALADVTKVEITPNWFIL